MPTERETELLANLEELHIRLQALSAPTEENHEQARLWQRRVAEVKETEAEVFARESALEEEEKRLAVSIDKLRRVTKDLLYLQYTAQVQKRLRYEEEAQLASTSEWAVGQLQRLRNTSLKASHMKRIRAEATKRFRETHGGEGSDGHGEAGAGRGAVAVADRVQTHAAESRMLQERMAVARQLYERRIDELRSQLDAARKKMRTITRRRKLEHEGFAHDVEQLQKELFEVVEFGDLDGALGA